MTKILFATCLALLIIWVELFGKQADSLLDADKLLSNRQYKKAITIYSSLLKFEGQTNRRAVILQKLSFAEIQIRAFDNALQHIIEAEQLDIKMRPDSLTAENWLLRGMCSYWMEKPVDALKYFQYALSKYDKLGDKKGSSVCLYWIGNSKAHGLYQFAESISYYKQALEKYPWERCEQWAAIQMNLSKAYLFSNELKASAVHLSNAETFYRSQSIYTPELADCLNLSAISDVFSGDTVNFFRQAFNAVALLKKYDDYHLGKYYDNIGAAYKLSGKGELALRYYREAARQHSKFSYNTYRISNTYLNIGEYFLDIESRPDSAAYYYRRCLTVRKHSFGTKHTETAAAYLHLGELFHRSKQYDSALYFFQEAMKSEVASFTLDNVNKNPVSLGTGYGLQLVNILSDKASVFRSKYEDIHDPELLNLAFLTLVRADSLLSVYRTTLYWQESKLAFNQSLRMIYYQALDYGYLLYQETGSGDVIDKCFYLMENARYTVLLEDIRDSQNEMRNREAQLRKTLDGLSVEIIHSQANSNLVKYLERQQDSLQQIMQYYYDNRAPQEKVLRKSVTRSIFANCKQFIKKEKYALASYFWADTVAYCIALREDQVSFFRIDNADKLAHDINRYKNLISHPSVSATTPAFRRISSEARRLYKTLLPLWATNEPPAKLVVIPDGALINMPYETLLPDDKDSLCQGFRCLPYLVKYTTMEYWFSFSIMDQLTTLGTPIKVASILAVAPEYHGTLIPLRGANREMENLLSFGATILKGKKATKLNFIQNARNYNHLHIASHARADTLNGLNSYINFSDEPNDRLYGYEFVDLKLNAKLVLLSACETGQGEMRKGEGMFSLGRAFAAAGAESIILSAWDVPDAATSYLVNSFYVYLFEEVSAAEALQKSKLEFMEQHDELSAHPYFWSSLYFTGHYQEADSGMTYKYLAAATTLLTIIGLVYLVKKRRYKSAI